jgi:hypothetical protein
MEVAEKVMNASPDAAGIAALASVPLQDLARS